VPLELELRNFEIFRVREREPGLDGHRLELLERVANDVRPPLVESDLSFLDSPIPRADPCPADHHLEALRGIEQLTLERVPLALILEITDHLQSLAFVIEHEHRVVLDHPFLSERIEHTIALLPVSLPRLDGGCRFGEGRLSVVRMNEVPEVQRPLHEVLRRKTKDVFDVGTAVGDGKVATTVPAEDHGGPLQEELPLGLEAAPRLLPLPLRRFDLTPALGKEPSESGTLHQKRSS
jgi:hypothetical protein